MNEYIECAQLVLNIATLLVSLCAYTTVQRYSARKESASFTFWSQLRVRLVRICDALDENAGYLNNMYSPEVTANWVGANPPRQELLNDFMGNVREFDVFLRASSDQMPARSGWSENMIILHEFLSNALMFDLASSNGTYKKKQVTIEERDNYCKKVCECMKMLISMIDAEQKRIEKKITKPLSGEAKKRKYTRC